MQPPRETNSGAATTRIAQSEHAYPSTIASRKEPGALPGRHPPARVRSWRFLVHFAPFCNWCCCRLFKMVQNARGIANCARAQEGGGRAGPLALLSMLSSRGTRVQTARYGSSRRRCSFIAAAAPASPISGIYRFYPTFVYLARSRAEPMCTGEERQTPCCWSILVAYFGGLHFSASALLLILIFISPHPLPLGTSKTCFFGLLFQLPFKCSKFGRT